tara:strand:- start:98 stop:952 length:855 start_codon:yes stop_codon:yes gene_type:complete
MDQAIYNAFVRGGTSCDLLLQAVSMGGAVNFQRKMAANTTALMAAAHCSRPDVIRALLEAGARPQLCDEYGRTALDFAVHGGHGPTIQVLDECSLEEMIDQNQQQTEEWTFGRTSSQQKQQSTTPNNMKVDHLIVDDDEDDEMCYDYFVMQGEMSKSDGGGSGGSGGSSGSAINSSVGAITSDTSGGEGNIRHSAAAHAFVKSYHFSLFEAQEQEQEEELDRIHAWMEMEQQADDEENTNEHFEDFDENHENYAGNDYPEMTSDEDGSEGGGGYDDDGGEEEWY